MTFCLAAAPFNTVLAQDFNARQPVEYTEQVTGPEPFELSLTATAGFMGGFFIGGLGSFMIALGGNYLPGTNSGDILIWSGLAGAVVGTSVALKLSYKDGPSWAWLFAASAAGAALGAAVLPLAGMLPALLLGFAGTIGSTVTTWYLLEPERAAQSLNDKADLNVVYRSGWSFRL